MITVITGPMFSGKSDYLVFLANKSLSQSRYKNLTTLPKIFRVVAKGELDVIPQGYTVFSTHSENKFEAIPITNIRDILSYLVGYKSSTKNVPVTVFIDEIQFLSVDLLDVVLEYTLNYNVNFCLSGLNLDYKGRPFETTQLLLSYADEIIVLKSVCAYCGNSALYSSRVDQNSMERILPSNLTKYIPLCRSCFYKIENTQKEVFK